MPDARNRSWFVLLCDSDHNYELNSTNLIWISLSDLYLCYLYKLIKVKKKHSTMKHCLYLLVCYDKGSLLTKRQTGSVSLSGLGLKFPFCRLGCIRCWAHPAERRSERFACKMYNFSAQQPLLCTDTLTLPHRSTLTHIKGLFVFFKSIKWCINLGILR